MKGFSWYPTSYLPRVAFLLMPVWVFQVYTALALLFKKKKLETVQTLNMV